MNKSRRHAFTLLEVLAATAVLVVMMVLLTRVFSLVSQSMISGNADAQNRRNIRALADFIGGELSRAVVPLEGRSTASAANLQFLVNPPSSQVDSNYRYADAIFWQAPIATETTFGEFAIVGYFVQWKNDTPYLCRLFINPSTTGADGDLVRNPDFLIYDSANSDDWLSKALLEKWVTPADKASGYRGLFAENVLGFWVRCFDSEGSELTGPFDSRVGYDGPAWTQLGNQVTVKRHLPASVEISLALVDDYYGMRLQPVKSQLMSFASAPLIRDAKTFLNELQTGSEGNTALKAILPGVRIYTKRIVLECAR